MHITAVVGSLRRDSFNRMLYQSAQELLPAGMTLDEAAIVDIPPYNDDVRLEHGYPPPVLTFRDSLFAADGILFISPEYNYSMPGVLKNAVDWASRPSDDQPFRDKPIGVMGASTGAMGTSRMQNHLRQAMVLVQGIVMPRPEVVITFAAQKFDIEAGRLSDEDTRDHVGRFLAAFAAWIERVRD